MNTEKTIKEIMENSDLYGLCENCGAIQLRKTFVKCSICGYEGTERHYPKIFKIMPADFIIYIEEYGLNSSIIV